VEIFKGRLEHPNVDRVQLSESDDEDEPVAHRDSAFAPIVAPPLSPFPLKSSERPMGLVEFTKASQYDPDRVGSQFIFDKWSDYYLMHYPGNATFLRMQRPLQFQN
jgi:hypothetical protein